MKFAELKSGWGELNAKTKLMAIGTFALIGCSIAFSLSNCSLAQDAEDRMRSNASVTVEEGVEISRDAEPIPLASDETRLLTTLVDILTNRECVWVSAEDDLCWIEFTEEGFTVFNGDITKTATVEFYSIEVIENGREGTWRVAYEDGTIYDASFLFIQNRETGVYAFTSSAFPGTYSTNAITSQDVLAW